MTAWCQGKIALHIGNHSLSLRSQIAWAATITIVTDVLNGRWDTASSNRLTARRAHCFLPELRSKPPMSYYNTSPLFFFAQVLARNISNPLNIDIFSKHTFHPPKNMELQPLFTLLLQQTCMPYDKIKVKAATLVRRHEVRGRRSMRQGRSSRLV